MSLEHFLKCTQNFKKYGLKTAAFVSTNQPNAFGPWPTKEGLPTLEIHRELPLDVQIKHMISLDVIDDIIISNCYPSDEELKSISHMRLDLVTFNVQLVDCLPEIERKIVLEELHFNRGDYNENMIRSTQSRVKYKGHHFKLFNVPEYIYPGDIVIESSKYGHYAGELQIAKTKMKNSGKSNVVGHIVEAERFLLEYIKPWQKFTFYEVN